MAVTFGNTWWGRQWLNSLSNIDYQNRIPRGATYARGGRVLSIKWNGTMAQARVQGRLRSPYKVNIVVPPFEPEKVSLLLDRLEQHPGIISHLLEHKLDPEVLSIAEGCGLKIFPSKWSDIKMVCSCPDWAVPCKHVAAVIYMLSREIDNNPFLVFQMHGVDLLSELSKRGISLESASKDAGVASIRDLAQTVPALKKDEKKAEEEKFSRRLPLPDLSRIEDRSGALPILLSDNPVFQMRGNFKDEYVSDLARVAKGAATSLKNGYVPTYEEDYCIIGEGDTLQFQVDSLLRWKVFHRKPEAEPSDDTGKGAKKGTKKAKEDSHEGDLGEISRSLMGLNADFLPDYTPSVVAARSALYCALTLLEKGAAVPQILSLDDKSYAVRWVPAMIDPNVREMISSLGIVIPSGMVVFDPTKRATKKVAVPGGSEPKKAPAPKPLADPASWMVSMFLDMLVYEFSKEGDDPIHSMFFEGERYLFDSPGQRETPGGINSWLSCYRIGKTDWMPVIRVSESGRGSFLVDLQVEYRGDSLMKEGTMIPLSDLLSDEKYSSFRFEALRAFTMVGVMISDLAPYISSGAKSPICYDEDEFVPFLLKVIPTARMIDIKVFMPRALQDLIRPKVSMKISAKPKDEKAGFTLLGMLDFDWQVALGDDLVSPQEFFALMKKASSLVYFRNRYIYADPSTLEKIKKALESSKDIPSQADILKAALCGEYKGAPVVLRDDVKELISRFTKDEAIPVPKEIKADLRPYQKRGYSWMYRNMMIGFGSILADDMGLGKTLQTITLMQRLSDEMKKDEGKEPVERKGRKPSRKAFLVVAPAGLLTNWEAEISRFAPKLSVFRYHGSARKIDDFSHDVMITSYGILRSDAEIIKKRKWRLMVIDEAQNIKNNKTAQSKAVKSIPADTRVALSGTPVENRLSEFWSIMDYTNKGYLGNETSFTQEFVRPIQIQNDQKVASRFRAVTAPFIMRRMKSDKSIISDLPDKVEMNDYASLTPSQAAIYTEVVQRAMEQIEAEKGTDHASSFRRGALVLQMMLALKQICNHPGQYLKNGDSAPDHSGKTQLLLERLSSILDSGEKVLIFTQFKEMGDMLVKIIKEKFGRAPMFLNGSVPIPERQEMVSSFQMDPRERIFILSTKAAGTGLNLTAATSVIHYDLWWNGAVESQATDRAYRIGQTKNVVVHRFITKGTFEEKIDQMIQRKKHLADMTVESGENWIGKLSNRELREIFSQVEAVSL